MPQPVPIVTEQDIERLAAREFPARPQDEVFATLSQYGTQPWHNEALRVRAAILKLAAGDCEKLLESLETAKSDYRDALALAEYPELFQYGFSGEPELTPEQRAEVEARDWRQYRDWFDR